MLKMRNPNGNAVFLVKNERRRKELKDLGFTEIENKVDLDKMKDEKLAKIKESIKE